MQRVLIIALFFAFLISLLSFLKVKVILVYDNGFKLYTNFLYRLRKKHLEKRAKRKTDKKRSTVKDSEILSDKKNSSIPSQFALALKIFKVAAENTASRLHFKIHFLRVIVSGENAAKTAITFGAIKALISESLSHAMESSRLELSRNSEIVILPNYTSDFSMLEFKLELYMYFFPALFGGWKILSEYIRLKPWESVKNGAN